MKIQEALSEIKALKADAAILFLEVQRKKEKTIYLSIEDKYNTQKEVESIDLLIEEALSKLAHAHDLKLAVLKVNTLVAIADLIQERDFLKSVCLCIAPLKDIEKETDPSLEHMYGQTEVVYKKTVATFNIDEVNKLYQRAIKRIREIENELQQKNWEVDVDEVLTEKFMKILDTITD